MRIKSLRYISTIALALALLVVMLGAYTRLTNAGLGCPDWPGCYGRLILPQGQQALLQAQHHYPSLPIETEKAWTEMIHRYAAGSLAFLILVLVFFTIRRSIYLSEKLPWKLPLVLLLLIVFQALLGMWTVTLKLLPVVVMGHLLGGTLIFSCLAYLNRQLSLVTSPGLLPWRPWVLGGMIIVFCQIALGGWVSSNYAGIACIGFPQCNGQWLPPLHFSQGFNLFSPVGENYQGGVLNNEIRATIQYLHRIGALVLMLYLFTMAFFILIKEPNKTLRVAAKCIIFLVCAQISLGIINVVYLLPLWAAVLHNGVAVLLLALLTVMLYYTQGKNS